MSSSQNHRGQHPNDEKLFCEKYIPLLIESIKDLSFLLSRDYSFKSALKIVGDKYRLNERQRIAIQRASCSDQSLEYRIKNQFPVELVSFNEIVIDGFNLLITLESALSGGIVLECRDGCYRDIASIHSTYRKVEETIPAIELIGLCLTELGNKGVIFYLDSPVSNSGRLKTLIMEIAQYYNMNWEVELDLNPDSQLLKSGRLIVTSDSFILDSALGWVNLSRYIIDKYISSSNIIRLVN